MDIKTCIREMMAETHTGASDLSRKCGRSRNFVASMLSRDCGISFDLAEELAEAMGFEIVVRGFDCEWTIERRDEDADSHQGTTDQR